MMGIEHPKWILFVRAGHQMSTFIFHKGCSVKPKKNWSALLTSQSVIAHIVEALNVQKEILFSRSVQDREHSPRRW